MHIDSPFVLWFVSINIGINAEVENYCILWSHVPLFRILKSKNWRINLCFIQSRYLCIWTELILISLTSKSVCRPGVVSEKFQKIKHCFIIAKSLKSKFLLQSEKQLKLKEHFLFISLSIFLANLFIVSCFL